MKLAFWSRLASSALALAMLAAPVMAQQQQEVGDAPQTRAGLFAVIFSVLFIVLVVVASVKNSKRGHDD